MTELSDAVRKLHVTNVAMADHLMQAYNVGASCNIGDYVVLNASDNVDQCFGSTPDQYAQALMYAVSQAIVGRTRYTVAYCEAGDRAPIRLVNIIDVSHPQMS